MFIVLNLKTTRLCDIYLLFQVAMQKSNFNVKMIDGIASLRGNSQKSSKGSPLKERGQRLHHSQDHVAIQIHERPIVPSCKGLDRQCQFWP
jgi:hypothetical protein